jgi:hypothetical protein
VTFEFTPEQRRAISRQRRKGNRMATRAELQLFMYSAVQGEADVSMDDYNDEQYEVDNAH